MSFCVKCKAFFPPGFTELTEDKQNKICLFCKKDKTVIDYVNENGVKKQTTRKEIIKEYKKFLKELKESPSIKKLIVNDAIKKSM